MIVTDITRDIEVLCIGRGLAPRRPMPTFAALKSFLILGVIASGKPDQGIALIKALPSNAAFAARVGQEIDKGVVIEGITRDYVYMRINGRLERVKVGEQLEASTPSGPAGGAVLDAAAAGIERNGDTVTISAALREHVVKDALGKVMMQAAAVPYYINGDLQGFRLWDIEPGSLYERAGFVNGDLVTTINGQRLADVGMAVRVLQSLRSESRAEITFVRGGVEKKVTVVIQ
jgi:general secretion pathway protein C